VKDLTLELSSHTDCRGSNAYNQELSQRRAQSCVDYIIAAGITKDRILAVGHGETLLVNQCADGVPCTEAEHQMNRRTELRIVTE
jgi:outer membrane protein OmpA-like peptidoglycan-associated protein